MEDLETLRKEDIKYLKGLLETRINQQKMLNNTLCEVMSRNSNSASIDLLKEELDEIIDEIKNINSEIARLDETDGKETVYSFYDNDDMDIHKGAMTEKVEKEESMGNGFYDSIVKQSRAAQFIEANNVKENVCNKSERQKSIIEKFRENADERIHSNRFLVDLNKQLCIPEDMVSSVSFDFDAKGVWICIYDFVANVNGNKMPIMEVLKYTTNEFDFSIRHLDASNKDLYVEHYTNCRVKKIFRDPIEYAIDDLSKIQIFISYQNVDYEASN